jgi:hypothetical protein
MLVAVANAAVSAATAAAADIAFVNLHDIMGWLHLPINTA